MDQFNNEKETWIRKFNKDYRKKWEWHQSQWLEHMMQSSEDDINKAVLNQKQIENNLEGRSGNWLYIVKDLDKIGI